MDMGGIRFSGVGQCTRARSDFREPDLRVIYCFANLSGLPDPYVGGMLTTNSIDSREPLGAESERRDTSRRQSPQCGCGTGERLARGEGSSSVCPQGTAVKDFHYDGMDSSRFRGDIIAASADSRQQQPGGDEMDATTVAVDLAKTVF